MKFINFYSGTALVLIASLLGSLGNTTGDLAPPLVLGALLATVLVLGWAGGASGARHEVDRLTRLEAGRQLQMACNAAARDRLETAAEVLRAQVRDSQAAIELFTAAQAKNMIRITALEGENAVLRKRPAIDVAPGAAGGVDHENDTGDDAALYAFAAVVSAKLAAGRAAGRGGWSDPAQCSIERLQRMLVECVAKGDPVDVGALAMLIHQRGGRTALAQHQQNPLIPLLVPQPLVEPVYIGKALMAHREARVVFSGSTGPVAAVHLVNIGLTGWVYTKETAEAYARGWNSGVRALRGALTEAVVGKLLPAVVDDSLAGSVDAASTCACKVCLRANGSE